MDTTQQERPVSLVKRLLIQSLTWGVGCGLVLATMILAILFYGHRAKGWDAHALRVHHVRAEGLSQLKFDEVSSGIEFSVDVENATAADVSLPHTLTTLGQTRGSHSLHSSLLRLREDYFLPARHVTTISLASADMCAANHPPQQCFETYFKDDEDLIIFDESHKYEILIPVPTLTLPRDQMTTSPERPAPVCKNGAATCEPWERDWSRTQLKPGTVVDKWSKYIVTKERNSP
jgi:hypothetical protein